MNAMRYFGYDDYAELGIEERVKVDEWLRAHQAVDKISLVQEIEEGERLLLSGPEYDENGPISQYDLVPYETLEDNTFPWEVLKNITPQVAE